MIPKPIIDQFLTRKLHDFRKFKKLTLANLEALKLQLSCAPPIWKKLKLHQKVGFTVGVRQRKFMFLFDTGMGKTLLSIALARYFRREGTVKRFLVLVPNRANKTEWAMQLAQHSPKSTFQIMPTAAPRKWAMLKAREQPMFTIETYPGLVRCVSVKGFKKTRMGRRSKPCLKPSRPLVKYLATHFDGVIYDEITFAKNHRSLTFRICRQLSKQAKVAIGLTGTPFGLDPMALWAQFFLIDGGETLGKSIQLFREAFFTETWNGFGVQWAFQRRKKKELNRLLANASLRYPANQADLPRVVTVEERFDLPEPALVLYRKAQATLKKVVSKNEREQLFIRMRQISSGFVGFKDDLSKVELAFPENPKLELLMAIIERVPPGKKIIVFHDYTFSGNQVCAALKKAGIDHVSLNGKTKNPDNVRRQFTEDPKKRVLVMNRAGGYGLNLQIAQYGIFYEMPVSLIEYTQMKRRIERQFSEHSRIFLYWLLARNTTDERLLQSHNSGTNLLKAVIDGQGV
jgi:superfamily II DNA or RNA helicase